MKPEKKGGKEGANSPWERFKNQLRKPKRLSKKEIEERKHAKERKALARRYLLRTTLVRAGIEAKPEVFSKWVFRSAVMINVFVALFIIVRFAPFFKVNLFLIPLIAIVLWLAIFILVFFLIWLILYLVLDLLSYKRKLGIEDVLSDYLLLASANIRAGMPIDRALWYAVRPRFGVLAKEMEIVAKETMSGEDLESALKKFAKKYNSATLNNTVSLIIEGINAGGEIAELLSKISQGIQDNKLLRKEMAAGISAYAIFITVSAIVMAPLLYALSSQLLNVIAEITSSIDLPEGGGVPTLAFATGGVGVTEQDFLIFAFSNLFFTSMLSAMIVSIIRRGDVKSGLKYIPIFIAFSMLFFWGAYTLFSNVFGGII